MKGVMKMAAALAALLLVSLAAQAQPWPAKPVRIISPHPPGGPGDVPFRGVSQFLAPKYGQPIVVENRPGANAVIGAELCAKAAADGYTLCGTNNATISLNPLTYEKLPYDPLRDFVGILNIGAVESALIVSPKVPANTLKELLDMVRAKPNSLTWSTIGVGSSGHLTVEWFRTRGIEFLHVPFKGGEQAMNAVVAGDVDVSLNASGRVASMVKAGKLKALAVDSDRPSQFITGVPPLRDSGFQTNMRIWIGLFAPTGTPRDVVQRLNTDINALLKQDDYVGKFLYSQGMVPVGGTVEEFNQHMRDERAFYEKLLKETGVKLGG